MSLRPETLKKYVELARPILVQVAKGRTFITYIELQSKMGGPGMEDMGEVLEEVSNSECENGRPLLSALVVHKTDRLLGNGFWELRVLPPSLKNAPMEEKKKRWEEEYKKAWECWKKHDP